MNMRGSGRQKPTPALPDYGKVRDPRFLRKQATAVIEDLRHSEGRQIGQDLRAGENGATVPQGLVGGCNKRQAPTFHI